MKTSILFVIIFLPSLLFAQSINKHHLGFTAGGNFLALSDNFRENYSLGVNAGFHHEWMANEDLSLSWEFNLQHCFPDKQELDPMQFGAVQFFTKFQNNNLQKDLQLFIKGGGGLAGIGKNNAGGHPGGFPIAIAFTGGSGANYILNNGDKIFTEISYRGFYAGTVYSSVSLNLGYSFWMNKLVK
jgi:hypothetical protein